MTELRSIDGLITGLLDNASSPLEKERVIRRIANVAQAKQIAPALDVLISTVERNMRELKEELTGFPYIPPVWMTVKEMNREFGYASVQNIIISNPGKFKAKRVRDIKGKGKAPYEYEIGVFNALLLDRSGSLLQFKDMIGFLEAKQRTHKELVSVRSELPEEAVIEAKIGRAHV